MAQIEVRQLRKLFDVPHREGGFRAALAGLFKRRYRQVRAVDGIDFHINEGEIVGFLGPNGAGKTTTLKMLTGLLYPTDGEAAVLGHVPWRREPEYLSRISLVMGQRSQLNWDLPAIDSFLVHLAVYQIDRKPGRQTMDELIDMLDIGGVIGKQVRSLSLGERMKCEICVSLLHQPRVLFLDEPTLGLDVTMQARIREFVADYNRRHGSTIMLTSHYMADVTALCRRVIVIDHGRILFDGELADLATRLAPFKVIAIDLGRSPDGYDFQRMGEVLTRQGHKIVLRVPRDRAAEITGRLLADLPVLDLTIEDPPIEDVIKQVFANGVERSS
ncbi:MAG TPA: ATP-binding cassette domain-containing protein [Phycisphaerae bacterium]|nr:ATP-binding cassette domain-containing protein [Phycisphaerae bacterium]